MGSIRAMEVIDEDVDYLRALAQSGVDAKLPAGRREPRSESCTAKTRLRCSRQRARLAGGHPEPRRPALVAESRRA